MTTREQLEQEAADRAVALNSPDIGHEIGYEAGFIAGRTVSAEQVEAATENYWNQTIGVAKSAVREAMTDMFRAAGLLIEGDDDE